MHAGLTEHHDAQNLAAQIDAVERALKQALPEARFSFFYPDVGAAKLAPGQGPVPAN